MICGIGCHAVPHVHTSLACRLTCLLVCAAAGPASYSRVRGVRRSGEGGHAGRGGREVQRHAHGVLHLQRDCSPQLPEGQIIWLKTNCRCTYRFSWSASALSQRAPGYPTALNINHHFDWRSHIFKNKFCQNSMISVNAFSCGYWFH